MEALAEAKYVEYDANLAAMGGAFPDLSQLQ